MRTILLALIFLCLGCSKPTNQPHPFEQEPMQQQPIPKKYLVAYSAWAENSSLTWQTIQVNNRQVPFINQTFDSASVGDKIIVNAHGRLIFDATTGKYHYPTTHILIKIRLGFDASSDPIDSLVTRVSGNSDQMLVYTIGVG
jgi:hypothetical protein